MSRKGVLQQSHNGFTHVRTLFVSISVEPLQPAGRRCVVVRDDDRELIFEMSAAQAKFFADLLAPRQRQRKRTKGRAKR